MDESRYGSSYLAAMHDVMGTSRIVGALYVHRRFVVAELARLGNTGTWV
jgi:hypothetical protein